ncbi:MAG: CdaR family protein [Bryobacteraceae bacterium]
MLRLITNRWPYKLFSLAAAALLWLVLVEEPEVSTSILVPVQYRNMPKDLEISSDVRDRIHVEVRGPASKLTPARLDDASVVMDLGFVGRAGERTFPVKDNMHLPGGVALDRAVPAQVRVRFEKRVTREVPVVVRIGSPPRGYEIVSQQVAPGRVRLVGPESRVREVESVETDPVDLTDTDESPKETEEFLVKTYVADPQVRVDGDGRVAVRVQLARIGAAGK